MDECVDTDASPMNECDISMENQADVNSLSDAQKHRCRVIYPQNRIDILRWFIRSERAGNWVMQVWTMKEMLPTLRGGAYSVHKIYLCVLTFRLIMDDNLSKSVQQQGNRYDSNKIIEYLDSDNLFESIESTSQDVFVPGPSFRISDSTWCHRTPLCHI